MLVGLLLATAAAAQNDERVGIRAENASFDNERGATHLRDNVRITRGELEIEADEGFVYRGEEGLRQIELFGAPVRWRTVTEAGGETTGQANEVVYDVIARTVTLIGDARIREQRGSFSGDQLVYNIDTQATEGQGGIRMEIEPETIDSDGEDTPDPD